MDSLLTLKDIAFSYDGHQVLHSANLSLYPGETVALLGPSGVGKSTIFRLIVGLETPNAGEVSSAMPLSQLCSYLTQDDLLLPWRTVLDNLLLMGELGMVPGDRKLWRVKALELLHEVGLDRWAEYYPDALSGGMRKRVALARALMSQRPLLLLDEPFQGLDFATAEQMTELLKHVKDCHQLTIMLITHDTHWAEKLAQRTLRLESGHIQELSPC